MATEQQTPSQHPGSDALAKLPAAVRTEWELDPSGVPFRHAARVVPLSAQGRALLVLGHDFADPTHRWWFTVGGGRGPGESARQAAVRELREEAGIKTDVSKLIGPVIRRAAEFVFATVTAKQYEEFFLLPCEDQSVGDRDWTAAEHEVLDELRWMSADELEIEVGTGGIPVYPQALPELLRCWEQGWDGQTVEITERTGKVKPDPELA